jgi:octaprenyl-diphosphate synthase
MAIPAGPLPAELPEVLRPVAADVAAVEEAFRRILAAPSDPLREMVSHAGRFSGKRLRPALTCIAARAVGGTVTPEVATVAAIVELIHTATLVHDDVLDGAQVRRKVATLNAIWGTDTAVLLGDVLFSRAYLAAARLEDRHASVYLSEVVGRVLSGEIRQNRERHNLDLAEVAYREIVTGKTSSLYEAAVAVGAHYAGARRALVEALSLYGHHLGTAFQIADDRLDLAGDEATVGKSLGTDLREGKTTLPVIAWLRSRPDDARAAARALVEEAGRDDVARATLVRRLRQDGALDEADAAARAEVDAAEAALEALPPGPSRDLLRAIARYVVPRAR